VAVLAALALLVWGHRDRMPNLAEATVNAASLTFLVGATIMVIANLATLRDQRNRMPETLAALPGSAEVRTRAVLLASGCVGTALAGLVIGAYLVVVVAQDRSAGVVDVREVLGGMAAAALLACAGVAFGRWLRSLVTVPALLTVLAMGLFGGPLFLLAWNLPLTAPYLTQQYGRPAGLRLAYLGAGVVLLAALALLRHVRRPLWFGAAASALAVVVVTGVAIPVTAPPRWGGIEHADAFAAVEPEHTCTARTGVTYCHFPGFAPWVPLWAATVDRVAAALPPAGRERLPTVVQRGGQDPESVLGPDPGHAVVGTVWYRGELAEFNQGRLASQVAAEVTGLADAARAADDSGDPGWWGPRWCNGMGQARTVVALWLAGQAAPVGPNTMTGIGYDEPELAYAEAMLARDDTRARVWRHWEALLDPSTGLGELASLLGVAGPAPTPAPGGWVCA
jgi:hypothetical protein